MIKKKRKNFSKGMKKFKNQKNNTPKKKAHSSEVL